jgi:predicted ATPase
VRGELQQAHEFAEQMFALAQKFDHRESLIQSHFALAINLYYFGAFISSCDHAEQGISIYDVQKHHAFVFEYGIDPGMQCLIYAAAALWHLGYADQSVSRVQDALTLAHQLSHPFSLTRALLMAANIYGMRREWYLTQEYAETVMTLASEQGFAQWLAAGTHLKGKALAMQGDKEAGIMQIQEGLTAMLNTGTEIGKTQHLAFLVEINKRLGRFEEGFSVLAETLALVEKTEVRFYESELHRLKGQLILQQSPDNATEAESCFHQAISIAQTQSAKSWELRAATSLARLWQQQGKHQKAYDLLEPVYSWFTEGFDTADLIDAKTLLDELA